MCWGQVFVSCLHNVNRWHKVSRCHTMSALRMNSRSATGFFIMDPAGPGAIACFIPMLSFISSFISRPMVPASNTRNAIQYIESLRGCHIGTSVITNVNREGSACPCGMLIPIPGQGTKESSMGTEHPLNVRDKLYHKFPPCQRTLLTDCVHHVKICQETAAQFESRKYLLQRIAPRARCKSLSCS